MGWWTRLLHRDRLEGQLDSELRDHLERQTAEYAREGMPEPEARRRALMALGGMEQVKESCRDARGTRWLEDLLQDLRYGLRVLGKSPVFTSVAVLSLALGIGANAAIFSLVDRLLLRTLPVREPDRLVLLDHGSWTNPIWEQIRSRQFQIFDGAVASSAASFDLATGGAVDAVDGLWTSGEFFSVLGVPPVLGRTLGPADDRRSGGPEGPVAMISYAFWQRRFGGAGDVVGRSLTLDRVPFTIIGVTPPDFFGPAPGRSFDVAVPIGAVDLVKKGQESWLDGRSTWWLDVIVRLKPGQSLDGANNALRGIQPQIREATLPTGWRPQDLATYLKEPLVLLPAASGFSDFRARYQSPLLALMGVVGLILLIACTNLANLLLARADVRRHEMSARLALGASRFRLARQLLTESLLLASLGAALGLLFARWGSRLLLEQITRAHEATSLDLSLDWRVLCFMAALAFATALLFGIGPALHASRAEPGDVLKQQGRAVRGDRRRLLGNGLVVVQVALSLVLLVTAGLFMQTFSRLAHLNIGIDRDAVLVVGIEDRPEMAEVMPLRARVERLVEAVSVAPGVSGAAASVTTPVSGRGWNERIEVRGGVSLSDHDRVSWFNAVTPGWFSTYGIQFDAGRDFDAHDRPGAPAVAIVNEAFVRRYLNGSDPIGRRFTKDDRPRHASPVFEIVGLVKNTVYNSLTAPMEPIVYLPFAQIPSEDLPPFASLGVRSVRGAPVLLTKTVADAIQSVDPSVSVTFRPFSEFVDASVARERILSVLSGFFGGLASLLAGIGLFGITSYGVSRRRAEIGVRMALGANATQVVRLVLRQVAWLVGLGVVAGTIASLWASQFVGSLLYGLEPRDPRTLAGAAVALAAVAALATWLPARQAARIDPAEVLREG